MEMINKVFKLKERGTNLATEVRGGLVTFFAMSYIVVLNPLIVSGKDSTGAILGENRVAAMTALVAGVLTILMGLVANAPMGLATGLGINALIAVTATTLPNATWPDIMGLVVIEGVIMLILVLSGFRRAIFAAVPQELRTSVAAGIGLFIVLIAMADSHFVSQGDGTPLTLGSKGELQGLPLIIFGIGILLTFILFAKKVKGNVLISIIVCTLLAFALQAFTHMGLSATSQNGIGWALSVPTIPQSIVSIPDFSLFGQFDIFHAWTVLSPITVVMLIFSILLTAFFDGMGTMYAISKEANLVDKDGNPIAAKEIFIVDSLGSISGGLCSIAPNTIFVESSTGIAEGAKTGLASIITGLCFLLTTFLTPLITSVPMEAVAPALIFVGFLMLKEMSKLNWTALDTAIPAFLIMVSIPFTYSITNGIGIGFISYVILKIAQKKAKDIHPLLWIVSGVFLIYFLQVAFTQLLNILF
ncbi:MAG: NCS2 family permease [Bifidobacteriaceae bacterium]|jgi:AGZA family xanthine/uracil permease-like MFS transporter|nr:NCS2 family permease [Bifidobacteriaceae bacterium]